MGNETPPPTDGRTLEGCEERDPPGFVARVRNWLQDRGSGVAYARLDGTLAAYCVEFSALLDALDRLEGTRTDGVATAGDRPFVAHVETLLSRATTHLRNGRIQRGWACFHAARRVGLYAYDRYDQSSDEPSMVRSRAKEIHREAMSTLSGWRREAVTDLLLDDSGTVRRDLSVISVIRARHLIDEVHQGNHAKRRYLQRQLRYLLGVGVVALVLFLWAGAGSNPLTLSDVSSWGFATYVPLLGVLGASLFGVRSASQTATSTKVPQNFTPFGVVFARVFVGALSALALYLALTAEIVNVAGSGGLSPTLLLTAAFAAGYSERLAPRAIERVSQLSEQDLAG